MGVINNIKSARMEKDILQEDLARAINCSLRSLSRYETGESSPSIEVAIRIARYLDLGLDDLFRFEPENAENQGGPHG